MSLPENEGFYRSIPFSALTNIIYVWGMVEASLTKVHSVRSRSASTFPMGERVFGCNDESHGKTV